MKKNTTKSAPLRGAFWDAGAQTFIDKGSNGRWWQVLSEEQVSKYERRVADEIAGDIARWLATGVFSEACGTKKTGITNADSFAR